MALCLFRSNGVDDYAFDSDVSYGEGGGGEPDEKPESGIVN